ncbi:MAG: cellulase family glycosylhydrolase [Aureispira sp.]|nr:cellulase family glycosylhydrolase [Aureispira sp.]
MKKLIIYIYLLLSVLSLDAQHLIFQDRNYFINGVNLPWNKFGWDFGHYEVEGVGYNPSFFEQAFTELEEQGVNCIRMWIHCDGRASPEFDEDGYVTGLDYNFFEHMDDFLERAQQHNLMVVFVLWSHDLLEDRKVESGRFAGMHADLITEEAKLQSYLDNALKPIVQRYKDQCNLLAWEIINEPEWAMNVPFGGTTAQVVKTKEMQYFIGRCIETIREEAAHQMVTVGSASLMWNSDVLPEYTNYWSDQVFEDLGFDPRTVYLDFYSPHYYEWMSSAVSPFGKHVSDWALDKPVLVGECRAANNQLSGEDRLNDVWEGEYAGILFWSYNAKDAVSDWDGCKDALQTHCNDNARSIVYEPECSALYSKAYKPVYIYPNPVYDLLCFEYQNLENQRLFLRVYDFMGRVVHTKVLEHSFTHQYSISITDLDVGLYVFEVILEQAIGGSKQVFCEQVQVF